MTKDNIDDPNVAKFVYTELDRDGLCRRGVAGPLGPAVRSSHLVIVQP